MIMRAAERRLGKIVLLEILLSGPEELLQRKAVRFREAAYGSADEAVSHLSDN